jgi:hypothetical protein
MTFYAMQLVNVLLKNNVSIQTFNHILHDIYLQEKTIFYEKKKNIENKKRTKFISKLYDFFSDLKIMLLSNTAAVMGS